MEMDLRVARAAGVLEGEGSFFTKTVGYSPLISCEMTDLDVLEELQDVFGGTIVVTKVRNDNWKQTWRWRISGEQAAAVMETIKKYMFGRRRVKIDTVLGTWYDRCAELNERKRRVNEAAMAYRNQEGSLRFLQEKYNVNYETIRKAARTITI